MKKQEQWLKCCDCGIYTSEGRKIAGYFLCRECIEEIQMFGRRTGTYLLQPSRVGINTFTYRQLADAFERIYGLNDPKIKVVVAALKANAQKTYKVVWGNNEETKKTKG